MLSRPSPQFSRFSALSMALERRVNRMTSFLIDRASFVTDEHKSMILCIRGYIEGGG